jgi:hypothetical protein
LNENREIFLYFRYFSGKRGYSSVSQVPFVIALPALSSTSKYFDDLTFASPVSAQYSKAKQPPDLKL